jgi:hypothetical protein
MKKTLRIAVTFGALALALSLALTACGGSGDSDGVASLGDGSGTNGSTTTAEQDPEQAALAFAKCMREQGVDMPDPGANGELHLQVGPGDEAKVSKAQKKCAPLLENARPRLSEEQQSVMQDALLAFAKCMREHGVDMPDPQFGEGGKVMQRAGRGVNPDDPKFQEAQEACEPILDEARRKAGLPDKGPGGSLRKSRGDT